MNRRQYGMLDLVKFLCAILIVSAHYITEYATGRIHGLIDLGISIYVVAVPFFFACSGYLLFQKVFAAPEKGGAAVRDFMARILKMYALWSVVYITFQVLTWVRFGVSSRQVLRYVLNCLFYSTYRTIWFLPALALGAGLIWLIWRKWGIRPVLIIAGVCYLIGCAGVSYGFLPRKIPALDRFLESYEFAFESTRNGLFNGFPLVALGAWMAHREGQGKSYHLLPSLLGCAVFGAGFIAEAFILKEYGSVNANTLLLLVPFTYCFLGLCLSIPMKSGKVLKWMRGMSTTVFVCQRIWLSALPGLLPGTVFATMLTGNPYVGWAYVLSVTLLTAAVIHWLGKRNRLIGAMC